MGRKKVIFASARKPVSPWMAEALAVSILPGGVDVLSVVINGVDSIDPLAVEVLQEIKIGASTRGPRLLEPSVLRGTTHFIAMGRGVPDSSYIPFMKGRLQVQEWAIEDPDEKDIDLYRSLRDKIAWRIKVFKLETRM